MSHLLGGEIEGQVVIDDVSSKVRRIIGVDRRPDAACQELAQIVLAHRREDAQFHIRQRADSQRDAARDQLRNERWILEAADAVIDARDAEQVVARILNETLRSNPRSMNDPVPRSQNEATGV